MFSKVSIKVLGRQDWRTCEVRNIVETEKVVLPKIKDLGIKQMKEPILYFEAKGVYEYEPENWTGMYTIVGRSKVDSFWKGEEVFLLGGITKVKLLK